MVSKWLDSIGVSHSQVDAAKHALAPVMGFDKYQKRARMKQPSQCS